MFPDNGEQSGLQIAQIIINHLTIKNATIGLLIQNNDGTTVSKKHPNLRLVLIMGS
jgi:hypothetical protein